MNTNLPDDLKQFVHDAVRAGRYAREDDVICDALTRLRQAMPEQAATLNRRTKGAKPDQQIKKPLTPAELDQYMLKMGLLSQLPDTDADYDDPDDEPIAIKGEPLSETVIRERR